VRDATGATPTDFGFTGQRRDASTGLMYYRACYYDSTLGRFISADAIVPGAASGAGGGVTTLGYDRNTRLTPLTVNLGEFAEQIGAENREVLRFGAFFQWDGETRQEHNVPMGPANPQALNRYSYVLNNPLRYVDPTGHITSGGNKKIGYESLEDDQGNPIMQNGHRLFKIWYGSEELYVTTDTPELAVFMQFADQYEDEVHNLGVGALGLGLSAASVAVGIVEVIVGAVAEPVTLGASTAVIVIGATQVGIGGLGVLVGLYGLGYGLNQMLQAESNAEEAFEAIMNSQQPKLNARLLP
jgi:RHS repeat-associated protein